MASSPETTQSIRSIPALAAAIRETHSRAWPTSSGEALRHSPLSTFYLIQTKSNDAEARAAAHLVSEVAERLRRLGDAYGEWDPFDPSAYFDLTESQTEQLVRVEERVNTVYIAFFVDPLLPSFYKAEAFWANHFFPAYHAANDAESTPPGSSQQSDTSRFDKTGTSNGFVPNGQVTNNAPSESAFLTDFSKSIFPEMASHWQNLMDVSQQVRRHLADHIGYLAVNGSQEERGEWRNAWAKPSPVMDGYIDLFPNYRTLPTLSLSIEFPLPVDRQPGRQQRLRLNRDRRRSSRR